MDQLTTIGISRQAGISRITLKRPPLNVLTIAMMRELELVLKDQNLTKDSCVLVLQAEGKAFSAGVDVADHTADKVHEMLGVFHRAVKLLRAVPVPTVALLHGAALGGGAELACACDLVLAGEKAKIGQPEICLGVYPPVALVDLPRSISPRKAAELLFTGVTLSARDAEHIGLINVCFPQEQFFENAEDWLKQLTKLSRSSLIETKKVLRETRCMHNFEQALDVAERRYLEKLMATADANEGISSFMEKREPRWSHR